MLVYTEVGAQGLIGVETPADRGGWGGDFLSNIVGMEEQIYNMVPGLFNLQSDLVMPYIASYGTGNGFELANFLKSCPKTPGS